MTEWRKQEEPAHRVRLSPFSIAHTPVTRGQWRTVMPDAPDEWEQDGSDAALPATHLDLLQALIMKTISLVSEPMGFPPDFR